MSTMPTLNDLPDDVLSEMLGHSTALTIISCRQVCRRLERLTRPRYVWENAFYRARHNLQRTMNPSTQSLPVLEKALVRAERLEQKWNSDNETFALPPQSYHLKNSEYNRVPFCVMGAYVIFFSHGNYSYEWFLRDAGGSVSHKNIAFEYRIPNHRTCNFPRYDSFTASLDHNLETLYVVSHPNSEEDRSGAIVLLAEIRINRIDSKPYLTISEVIANPQNRRVEHMTTQCPFVSIYSSNSELQRNTLEVNILNLHSKEVSQYRLVLPSYPPLNNLYPKLARASDTHILLFATGETAYCAYARPATQGESCLTPSSPRIDLHAIGFDELKPFSVLRESYKEICETWDISFILVGSETRTARDAVPMYSLAHTEGEWRLEPQNDAGPGSNPGGTCLITPLQHDYVQGFFTLKITDLVEGGAELRRFDFHMLRVDGLVGSDGGELKLSKLDLSPWVYERVDGFRCVDFDPFGGIALLAGRTHTDIQPPEFQPIVVLDWSTRRSSH
ncbi:hypothetical protein NP233_g9604 [Leucocoprinus birnbaumii]|uniref:F-box domain-containing protein n=1 Tax=Leucocoprinus birnbaumii TaxID=56174 RepID=A0AAD5VLT6_9AGAR|nr:hypothetical protein NP233_g9604 [Leucocoprinus birnbaumii]